MQTIVDHALGDTETADRQSCLVLGTVQLIPYPFTDVRTLNSDVLSCQDFRHFRVATILVLLIFSLMFCELFNKIITN